MSLLHHALFKESVESSPVIEGQQVQDQGPMEAPDVDDGFITFNEEKRQSQGGPGAQQHAPGKKKSSTKPLKREPSRKGWTGKKGSTHSAIVKKHQEFGPVRGTNTLLRAYEQKLGKMDTDRLVVISAFYN